jgi:hypothetical protein
MRFLVFCYWEKCREGLARHRLETVPMLVRQCREPGGDKIRLTTTHSRTREEAFEGTLCKG